MPSFSGKRESSSSSSSSLLSALIVTQNFSFWNDSRILCDLQLDETTQAKLDKEKEKNVKAIYFFKMALSIHSALWRVMWNFNFYCSLFGTFRRRFGLKFCWCKDTWSDISRWDNLRKTLRPLFKGKKVFQVTQIKVVSKLFRNPKYFLTLKIILRLEKSLQNFAESSDCKRLCENQFASSFRNCFSHTFDTGDDQIPPKFPPPYTHSHLDI